MLIILITRYKRYLCEYEDKLQMTWDKSFAKKFETREEALEFIKSETFTDSVFEYEDYILEKL